MQASEAMIFKDTIMIKDRPYDRAVEVIVIAPDVMNVDCRRLI
jgi:hypothetical protein